MNRRFRTLLLVVMVALLAALIPVVVLAQDTSQGEEGLLFRVNGPVTIGSQETIDNVIVINDNVTVAGTITGTLVVINGDAIITGQVLEEVTVFRGTLDLASSATVDNVSVIRGDFVRADGATVTGSITEGDFQISPWDWGIFWAFLWVGGTLVVLTAGVIFAGIGGRQLKRAGDTLRQAPGPMVLGVVAAWFLLPILMFMALFTVIGVPLSIAYFLFVLPIVWFAGYLVAGTQLGRMILRSRYDEAHPYLPAMLGLLILQLVGIVPVFGGLIAFLAGVAGSGALLVLAWRAWKGPGTELTMPQAEIVTPTPVT
jgi:hypothetical protein